MQNIIEILRAQGIEVPEDKAAEVTRLVAQNYRTIAEHNKRVTQLEAERDDLKTQLTDAANTLKSFEGIDPAGIKQQLADYQARAENAERDYKAKLEARDFDSALEAALAELHFSSNAARSAVAAQIREKGLRLDNGKILGLNDALALIRTADPDAFIDDATPPARFTAPISAPGGAKYTSRDQIMAIKDATERQAAIAANMELFSRKE